MTESIEWDISIEQAEEFQADLELFRKIGWQVVDGLRKAAPSLDLQDFTKAIYTAEHWVVAIEGIKAAKRLEQRLSSTMWKANDRLMEIYKDGGEEALGKHIDQIMAHVIDDLGPRESGSGG